MMEALIEEPALTFDYQLDPFQQQSIASIEPIESIESIEQTVPQNG